ncbi:hypothetical protein E2C01_003134 [Portunus trituberculatus]|uniref:Uncharacterized protein n=1 Tax=Portunus trituberculatus TaxID=210409 RepID=A0A5B7CLK2_PORTR|nr:hypothetical protein [Portunus trituberculatus]
MKTPLFLKHGTHSQMLQVYYKVKVQCKDNMSKVYCLLSGPACVQVLLTTASVTDRKRGSKVF